MNIYPHGYYVYAYLRKNGSPYYIGKGTRKRAWSTSRSVPKPSNDRIIILESNLTNIGALALERRYIEWYGRKDNNTGILRNKTDGGEGSEGYIPSEETRKKLGVFWRGKKHSEETKLKISTSMKGRKRSAEHTAKIVAAKASRKLMVKQLY